MSNWEKDYEAAQRERERNQELKRHNDLLDRQTIQQRLASEEKNRLLADLKLKIIVSVIEYRYFYQKLRANTRSIDLRKLKKRENELYKLNAIDRNN